MPGRGRGQVLGDPPGGVRAQRYGPAHRAQPAVPVLAAEDEQAGTDQGAGDRADQALALDERPSLGLLNAIYGKAHAAALRGDRAGALALDERGRRVFDSAGTHEQTSDYAVPWWRLNVFRSLLLARLGEEKAATEAQDQALAELPATLPRFATHLELHRGLMLARSGDRAGGVAHATTAMEALPPEKHSLTLRMLVNEIRA
ncbi:MULTISPECIES: hypothetical protein [unclassified Streptomyces]|uniref:hypothetical protein n=1 Tax=unclassified Streptomyces TaxID=2593676 RepID=UPI00386C7892